MVKCPRCGFEFEPSPVGSSPEQQVPTAGSTAAPPPETKEE